MLSGADDISAQRKLRGQSISPMAAVGDYRIVREIGRGGMGVVYEAEQLSLGRKVALKVLPFAGALDHRQLKRFKSEAQAAAMLHHPNIVPVHGIGSDRGVHYYAMQLIEESTLADVIHDLRRLQRTDREPLAALQLTSDLTSGRHLDQRQPVNTVDPRNSNKKSSNSPSSSNQSAVVSPAVAETHRSALSTQNSHQSKSYVQSIAEIGIQIAEALDHAHDEGVFHRDIKLSNLILDDRCKPWITDFGLAIIEADVGLTMTGDLVATLRYMSPEQALAKRVVIDHRTDIYSLCASL